MCNITLKDVKKIKVINTIETYKDGPKIHILEDNNKYKELPREFRSLRYIENKCFYDELKKQAKLYGTRYFAFPKQIVVNRTKLYGYIAKFIEGCCLYEEIDEINFEYLINMTESLENSILNITEKGCQIEDLHSGNIIINKDYFSIIDTDMYCFYHSKTQEELEIYNMRQLARCVLSSIVNKIDMTKVVTDRELLNKFSSAKEGTYRCSSFLKDLQKKLFINPYKKIGKLK